MSHATLQINGKHFVLVPDDEYRKLTAAARAAADMPGLPPADQDGNLPAVPSGRVSIAREIIRRRHAAGLSQKALAASAGIRAETLNRIEKAKVTPDTDTITKVDRALRR